ncbi:MAG: hypothetical protein ABR583_05640 [Gaiellaceae bacterium]
MSRPRTRSLLAATAAAGLLAYGIGGHGLAHAGPHAGLAAGAAGLCLLLVTVLRRATPAALPEGSLVLVGAPFFPTPVQLPTAERKARASPPVLQRFRN